jgi:hypothetical protein
MWHGVVASALTALVTGTILGCVVDDTSELGDEWPVPLAGLELPPCELAQELYRIEAVQVPSSPRETEELGFDLDRDAEARVDNAGGMLLTLMRVHHGEALDVEARVHQNLRKVDWMLAVGTCDDGYARVELRGPSGLGVVPAVGWLEGDRLWTSGGVGAIAPGVLFDLEGSGPVRWVTGVGLIADLVRGADGGLTGRIGLALAPEAVAEQSSDRFVRSLAQPDLDVLAIHDGEPVWWPGRDGISDSISLGIGIRATPVAPR